MKRTSVDDVLRATHESVLAVGVRRTTFAEVGRRAGLSRATLYTHFPDVESAIAALLTRELGALLSAADAGVPVPATGSGSRRDGRSDADVIIVDHSGVPGTGEGVDRHARSRLVTAAGRILDDLPEHPLFRKIIDVDTDLLLPYVVSRLGSVQRLALAQVHRRIREGQADGSIRQGDPQALALTVMLSVQGALLASQTPEVAAARDALHAALLETIDRGLRP